MKRILYISLLGCGAVLVSQATDVTNAQFAHTGQVQSAALSSLKVLQDTSKAALEQQLLDRLADLYGRRPRSIRIQLDADIKSGDTYDGAIGRETSDGIYLDRNPCKDPSDVIFIRRRYDADEIGYYQCGSRRIPKYQVVKE